MQSKVWPILMTLQTDEEEEEEEDEYASISRVISAKDYGQLPDYKCVPNLGEKIITLLPPSPGNIPSTSLSAFVASIFVKQKTIKSVTAPDGTLVALDERIRRGYARVVRSMATISFETSCLRLYRRWRGFCARGGHRQSHQPVNLGQEKAKLR